MTRQGWVLTLLLGGMAAVSQTLLYREIGQRSTARLDGFPKQLGNWTLVRELEPTQREIELLETENILTRVYRDEQGRQVALVLVYDPSGNRKMAHPQEICLKAGGQETVDARTRMIGATGIDAQRLLMERGGRRTLYYYWFKAGAYQSGSYIQSQLRLAYHSLWGAPEGAALIRISAAAQRDGAEADLALQDFARALLPSLKEQLP